MTLDLQSIKQQLASITQGECPFCQGAHDWENCDIVYTPITDCEHKDADDGCCHHPKNMTPECHVNACPRLNRHIVTMFNKCATPHDGQSEVKL